jgi:hypothetical protein
MKLKPGPWNVPEDDRHPRSKEMYRNTIEEVIGDGVTPIIQGDWKLNVHQGSNKSFGYRRYHKHGKRWYCVISYTTDGHHYPGNWKCGHCGEHVPEEMEGYINLARWAANDVDA